MALDDAFTSARRQRMSEGRLRAWVEMREGKPGVLAAFVGVPPGSETPLRRLPATRHCTSHSEARQWVEDEARALGGVAVEWVSGDARARASRP
jgi:hypothetical protein